MHIELTEDGFLAHALLPELRSLRGRSFLSDLDFSRQDLADLLSLSSRR